MIEASALENSPENLMSEVQFPKSSFHRICLTKYEIYSSRINKSSWVLHAISPVGHLD